MNSLYVQDFDRADLNSTEDQLGEFGLTLLDFLAQMDIPPKILALIHRVDFRPAKVRSTARKKQVHILEENIGRLLPDDMGWIITEPFALLVHKPGYLDSSH